MFELRIALSVDTFNPTFMKQILCEHPVIILHPSFKSNLLKYKTFSMKGEIIQLNFRTYNEYLAYFPYSVFSPKRLGVTVETVDDYYVIDPLTGSIYPMFIAVPCGKCVFCRDKKAKEWAFRAVCENTVSTSRPLFLTLTYNPRHLPPCGVFKEELQLFLKRLRIRLTRRGVDHNIRYFACSEYGSKSGRPHYHMIIWNYPDADNLHATLKEIESAWSVPTGEYNSDGSPVTDSLGFCYVVPCQQGAISYVMKYMRKDPKIPKGMNPVFFLSSRRNGGIGSAYAYKCKEFYRLHPQCLDLTVVDPYSGMTFTAAIPQYFKRIFFPSLSQHCPKTITDLVKKVTYYYGLRKTFAELLGIDLPFRLNPMERKVLKSYKFLNIKFPKGCMTDEYNRLSKMSREQIINLMDINEMEIDSIIRTLSIFKYPSHYIVSREKMMAERQIALDFRYGNRCELDLNDLKYNLVSKLKLAELKEII